MSFMTPRMTRCCVALAASVLVNLRCNQIIQNERITEFNVTSNTVRLFDTPSYFFIPVSFS